MYPIPNTWPTKQTQWKKKKDYTADVSYKFSKCKNTVEPEKPPIIERQGTFVRNNQSKYMHFHNICSDKVKGLFVQGAQETDYQSLIIWTV